MITQAHQDVIDTGHLLPQPQQMLATKPRNKINQKLKKIIFGVLAIGILLLVTSCILYFAKKNSKTIKIEVESIYPADFYIQNDVLVLGKQNIKDLTKINTSNLKKLILQSGERISIAKSQFPNLQEVILNSAQLIELDVDSNLKLESLVINNSMLTTFTYNSAQLKNLLLLNNFQMRTFCKSILPSLSNLTIFQTHIFEWYDNKFQNLSVFYIQNSFVDLPLIEVNSIAQFSIKTCNISNISAELLSKIRNLTIESTSFHGLEVRNFNMTSINISNCNMWQINIYNSQYLSVLTINNTFVNSLKLQNMIGNTNIKLFTKQLRTFDIRNISFFDIASNNESFSSLENLSISDTNMKDILYYFKLPKIKIIHFQRLVCSNFSTSSYKSLKYLRIYSANVVSAIINSESLQQFYMSNFIFSSQFNLNLTGPLLNVQITNNSNITSLNYLAISEAKSVKITSNRNLNSILSSNFRNIENLVIQNNQVLYRIQNCIINAQTLKLSNLPKLQMNQKYPNTTNLTLSSIKSFQLSQFNIYFPNAVFLSFETQNNSGWDFVGANSESLKQIKIDAENMSTFGLNSLHSLKYLTIRPSLVVIQSNYMPSLIYLDVSQDQRLNMIQLIDELQSLKSQGTKLQKINLPQGTSSTVIQQIKKLFPEIIVTN